MVPASVVMCDWAVAVICARVAGSVLLSAAYLRADSPFARNH